MVELSTESGVDDDGTDWDDREVPTEMIQLQSSDETLDAAHRSDPNATRDRW